MRKLLFVLFSLTQLYHGAQAQSLNIEMVEIPGGTFRMGDMSGEGGDYERPVHSVTIEPFRLGKYEVTFAQWESCVADGGCGGYTPDDYGWGGGPGQPAGDRCVLGRHSVIH